jgi:dihydrofolate synthase/folylpolyglutamate synthase
MTYADAIADLYGLRMFGLKLGLENPHRLAALAGNPQEILRFIHVAGTNGKGSTCALLESVCRASGLRVGLFTSPHLVSFAERFQVDRVPASEAEIVQLVSEIQPLVVQLSTAHGDEATASHPTFFEVVTVMALRHFAAQRCDIVIWETGMGGRLDATNIVTPLASVITSIGLDHQNFLGNTLREIAAEKSGIIKPRVPIITGADSPEALAVITETSARLHAPLTIVTRGDTAKPPLDTLELQLLGDHQRLNAAVAIATLRALRDAVPVTDDALRRGLASAAWPGRLQRIRRGAQQILLDGAHNIDSARALRDALAKYFPGEKPVLILGILRDKSFAEMCALLAPLASRILLVPVQNERTASTAELFPICRNANPTAAITECASLREALARAGDAPFLTITGSLYLIGEAMELLGVAAANASSERALNESHRVVR